ncbi:lysylphosphatidylglycerol synthase transmembrane domain-containing protein [Rugosimonospora africana]|uniref:lysylphosphatidylglycerol synthase transmembrane domain-containing protein n=1 Tax=Rugosimonospora africana TaxID=556532 RepID=UPI00357107C2
MWARTVWAKAVRARAVWAWVRVLGGAGIIAFLLWRLGTGPFLDGLRGIDVWALLAATGIGVLTTVACAWRWRLVARGLGVRLPLRTAVAAYYRSQFINTTLPGGVLGDVHRALRHGRDVGDVGRAVRAVVLERFAGQVVQVAIAVVMLLALPSPVRSRMPEAAAVLAVVGLGAVLLAWMRPGTTGSRVARALRTAAADLRSGLFSRRNGPGIVLASAVVVAGHLATFLVTARAAGATAPLTRLAPLGLLILLAMTVPLNVGGWGPREGAAAWAFGAAGLSATLGVSTAVVYGVLALVATAPGAGVLVMRWMARIRVGRSTPQPPIRCAPAGVRQENAIHG